MSIINMLNRTLSVYSLVLLVGSSWGCWSFTEGSNIDSVDEKSSHTAIAKTTENIRLIEIIINIKEDGMMELIEEKIDRYTVDR